MSKVGSTPPSWWCTADILFFAVLLLSDTIEERGGLIGPLHFWMIRSWVLESYTRNLASTWKWMYLPLNAKRLGHPKLYSVKIARAIFIFEPCPFNQQQISIFIMASLMILKALCKTQLLRFLPLYRLCLAQFECLVCLISTLSVHFHHISSLLPACFPPPPSSDNLFLSDLSAILCVSLLVWTPFQTKKTTTLKGNKAAGAKTGVEAVWNLSVFTQGFLRLSLQPRFNINPYLIRSHPLPFLFT